MNVGAYTVENRIRNERVQVETKTFNDTETFEVVFRTETRNGSFHFGSDMVVYEVGTLFLHWKGKI